MVRLIACSVALIFSLGTLYGTSPVSAQDNEQRQRDQARGAFERGLNAVKDEKWEEALLAFETSFELEASPKTRINIALVQIQLGLLVEAYAHLQAISNSNALDSKTKSAAGEQAAELSKKIPKVELELRNMLSTDRLFVRGVETTLAPGQRSIIVNPGRHTINIMRDGNIIVSEDVLLREGAITKVVLDANQGRPGLGHEEPQPSSSESDKERSEQKVDRALATGPNDDEGGSVFEQWWFWTAVGVVVAGGVVAAVVVANQSDSSMCQPGAACFDFDNP